ncbi:Uncharacterised protein [[Flavobacterium] thermophilum]|nr:Uncharacterised protein [[Flavobacterium] thermophilum]
MQEHFHFTTDRAKIQKQYAAIFVFVSAQLSCIQVHLHRRNRHLVKQEDAVIIAIHLLGKLLGFTSERAWHRFVTGNLFTNGSFLERSRYNRRCRALGFAIKWIRHEQNVANIMPMPSWTACRSHCAIRQECIASNGFKRSPTSGIALPKSNGTTG